MSAVGRSRVLSGVLAILGAGAVAIVASTQPVKAAQLPYIVLSDSAGTQQGTAGAPLRTDPTGTTTQPVSGTFWQATQPVSGTFWQATQPVSCANCSGTVAVSGTFWQATQPVSGTVTANAQGGNSLPLIECNSSAVLNIGSATTTQLVALSGSTVVYVCGYSFTISGTSPTVKWEYGTGSSCGSGTTALSGTYAISSGSLVASGSGLGSIFRTTAGQALCLVSGGTSPSIQGVLSYAQF